MATCEKCVSGCNCPLLMGRRGFLGTAAAGAAALAAKVGLLDFAASVLGEEPKPQGKPVVRAVFLRPKSDGYWMSWPGESFDVPARQADYVKTMTDAATALGVHLDVQPDPIENLDQVNTLLEQLKAAPPDGLLVTLMHMAHWPQVNHLVANRGELPTIVFAPMGTTFTGHLQATRNAPKCFVASTQDYGWLSHAVRMFKTLWQMKNTRLLIIAGDKTEDRPLSTVGTTLHYIPLDRWPAELAKTETSDEVRAMADYYAKEAKGIVEPKPDDILNAAKNYVVAKRLMAAENCQGISMNCLGLVGARRIPCPPCIAWSRLLDEGSVGACEADWNAAISLLLSALLTGRPGFMQDPVPNTVTNTFMGAHCTSPTKLEGPDKPHMPFVLRSHSESNIGTVPQVLWPLGQPVTVMKFEGPETMILGTGRVVGNIDTPPSGGCRTSVDLEMDGITDSRDVKGFHQLFILGKLDRQFMAYAQLAGIKVVPV